MKIIFILLFWGMVSFSYAQTHELNPEAGTSVPIQTITLKDGTVLKGHLSAVAGDFYTVETTNLGQVTIPAGNVFSITTQSQPAPTPSSLPPMDNGQPMPAFNNLLTTQPQFAGQAAQAQEMLKDPEVMAEVQNVFNDPQLMALFQDKTVMQDLMSMDPNKVQNNPNIQALLQNPKMQAILSKLMGKMTASPNQN